MSRGRGVAPVAVLPALRRLPAGTGASLEEAPGTTAGELLSAE
jgi:hypothetical protein